MWKEIKIPIREVCNVAARLNAARFLRIPAVPSELFSSDVIKHDGNVPVPMSLLFQERENKASVFTVSVSFCFL